MVPLEDGSLRAGISSSGEPPNTASGNQIWVLCKDKEIYQVLIPLSSPSSICLVYYFIFHIKDQI